MLADLEVWWFMHRRGRPYVVGAGVAALLLAGFLLTFLPGRGAVKPSQVLAARSAGRYERALQLLADGIKRDPANRELVRLRSQLTENLEVDFRMRIAPQDNRAFRSGAAPADLALGPSDGYYLLVRPSAACYLYVFQITSTGEVLRLFPNRKPKEAPAPAGAAMLRIPDGNGWLHLKPARGTERIVLVAAHWEIPVLERLAGEVSAEKNSQRRSAALKRLLDRLALEERATGQIPGLVYGICEFQNLGAQTGSLSSTRRL